MEPSAIDPKAGERAYYANLSREGIEHARHKPFAGRDCGKHLSNLGALLMMLEAPPRSVLDLGCGTGWTSVFLARAGYEVLGIDLSGEAIEMAREMAREGGAAKAKFQQADYEEFKSAGTFDYALFYDSLHHAEDERAAIRAAYDALKPGGVLFAFEPGAGHSRSPAARHAVATYGVHEKDMPPGRIRQLGRQTGFQRVLVLPLPHEASQSLFRRDYLSGQGGVGLVLEKLWGYSRLLTKTLRLSRSGLVLMWK